MRLFINLQQQRIRERFPTSGTADSFAKLFHFQAFFLLTYANSHACRRTAQESFGRASRDWASRMRGHMSQLHIESWQSWPKQRDQVRCLSNLPRVVQGVLTINVNSSSPVRFQRRNRCPESAPGPRPHSTHGPWSLLTTDYGPPPFAFLPPFPLVFLVTLFLWPAMTKRSQWRRNVRS